VIEAVIEEIEIPDERGNWKEEMGARARSARSILVGQAARIWTSPPQVVDIRVEGQK
jgi:hypothetical protein